jgi:hypothetical protein
MNSHDKNETGKGQFKKTYRSPVIQIYGNIRALTNSAAKTNMNDGMLTGNTRTS